MTSNIKSVDLKGIIPKIDRYDIRNALIGGIPFGAALSGLEKLASGVSERDLLGYYAVGILAYGYSRATKGTFQLMGTKDELAEGIKHSVLFLAGTAAGHYIVELAPILADYASRF